MEVGQLPSPSTRLIKALAALGVSRPRVLNALNSAA